ncbi:odorant receptor 7a-like [Eurosta solidaginis]|uniref:odorant receptor 7a-like n=1 Tax=Eurosta solidaginis TaxID=178769 RepID=UPI003530961C
MLELLTGRKIGKLRSSDSFICLFKGFTIIGTNPPMNAGRIYYMWSAILNLCIIILSPFVFTIGFNIQYLILHTINTTQFLSGLQAGINVIGIPPKGVILAISLKRMRSIEPILNIMDARYTKFEDISLIRAAVIMGNRIVVSFGLAYFTYMLLTAIPPLCYGQVPFSVWIPFLKKERSLYDFYAQIFFDLFFMIFALFHQVLNDSYSSVYICVIRMHMQLLVRRVRRLGMEAERSYDDNLKELVGCIETHQQILRLVSTIEPIISKTMFTQFLILASVLCVTMINMFIYADWSTQIASACYFMCVLLQTAPCCYYATELLADSALLPDAIFHCSWMEQDKRFKKLIIYFMQHSQLPLQLTALNLFPINVSTNVSIAKFSFTLFTFIKEMGVGKNFRD